MGDSSVSCVMSGVSMHAERAVLIALAPTAGNRMHQQPRFPHGARVVAEGALALFSPLLLPIYGRVDCYGRLTDIEEDEHTKFLEERLQKPIGEIADKIAYGDRVSAMEKFAKAHARYRRRDRLDNSDNEKKRVKRHTWDGRPFGCYVHRDIWDRFSRNYIDDEGQPSSSVWDAAQIGPEVLLGMGFVRQELDRKKPQRQGGSTSTLTGPTWKRGTTTTGTQSSSSTESL